MNKIKLLIFLIISSFTFATVSAQIPVDSLRFVYKLHGQTRKFQYVFIREDNGGVRLSWGIERNLKWWTGSYTMTPEAVMSATRMSYMMPEDGNNVTLPSDMTFAMISARAFDELKTSGEFFYNSTGYRLIDTASTTCYGQLLHVADSIEGAEMWILDRRDYPIVWEMRNNPLEINWKAEPLTVRPVNLKTEIALTPEKSGGIYYAYPYDSDVMPDVPTGYKPLYLSHYGRHGSRWIIKEWQYGEVLNIFRYADSCGNLTQLGKDVMARVDSIARFSIGHAGELSPIGEKQHKAISRRMSSRFPSLFTGDSKIVALSSTEPRCIVSMAAFCEQLKENNPRLQINRHVTPGNMNFIAYSTPEAKSLGRDDAEWRKRFYEWCDSVLDSDRLIASLFVTPDSVPSPKRLMVLLHNIAVGQQDINSGVELLDIFSDEELYELWRHLNYNMYVRHACAADGNNYGPQSARSLLKHIVDDADAAIEGKNDGNVMLRFGHDTNLIRLLALMKIDGMCNSEYDHDRYHLAWQDFKVSPMGANLQLHFFRNDDNHIIVMLRHNERPVTLPIKPVDGTDAFYNWDAVKALWMNEL